MKSTRTRTPVSVPLHERKCMDVNMGSYDHEMLRHINSNDQIATTWTEYSLGNRGSIRNGHSTIGFLVGNGGRWNQQKVPKLFEPQLFQTHFVLKSNPRTFSKYCSWSWAARECTGTERIYRVHLPRRECQLSTLNHEKWVDPGKTKSRTRKMNIVWKKLHATWQSQRLFHSIIHGNLITIQYIVALAQEKRLLFYLTKSHVIVLYATQEAVCIEKMVCVEEGWTIPKKRLTNSKIGL